jgi:hypothetical protein
MNSRTLRAKLNLFCIHRRIVPSTLLAWTDFHAKFRVKMSGLVCKSSDLARMVP